RAFVGLLSFAAGRFAAHLGLGGELLNALALLGRKHARDLFVHLRLDFVEFGLQLFYSLVVPLLDLLDRLPLRRGGHLGVVVGQAAARLGLLGGGLSGGRGGGRCFLGY